MEIAAVLLAFLLGAFVRKPFRISGLFHRESEKAPPTPMAREKELNRQLNNLINYMGRNE